MILIHVPVCGIFAVEPSSPVKVDLESYRACGVTSLYLAARILGTEISLAEVQRNADPDGDSITSFADLSRCSQKLGLQSAAFDLTLDELRSAPGPAVVEMRQSSGNTEEGHFLVFLGFKGNDSVLLLDAPKSPKLCGAGPFQQAWTGKAIFLLKSEGEVNQLRQLFKRTIDGWRLYLQFPLSAFLVVCVVFIWKPVWTKRFRRNPSGGKKTSSLPKSGSCLLLMFGLLLLGCHDAAKPHLVASVNPLALGVVSLTDHNVEFPLENKGSGMLSIQSIQTTCACTSGRAPDAIRPGETGKIEFKLSVRKPGPGSVRIRIDSNDPDSPHTFSMSWFGEQSPKLVPPALAAEAAPGEVGEQFVSIVYAGGDPNQSLSIRSADSSNPEILVARTGDVAKAHNNLDAKFSNQIVVAEEVVYRVSCPISKAARDPITGTCRFNVEQAGKTYELNLPVRFDVTPSVKCMPPSVTLVTENLDQLVGARRELLVVLKKDADLEILATPDFLDCSLQAAAADDQSDHRQFVLRLNVTKVPVVGNDGRIRLCIRGDKSSETEIPISVKLVEPLKANSLDGKS